MLGSYNYRRSDDSDIICGFHDEVPGLLVSQLISLLFPSIFLDPSSPCWALHSLTLHFFTPSPILSLHE
jgi:hypothetical protein